MCSTTTLEKESSNARGCHTENNLALGAQMIAKGVVEIGLACTSRTMKEKDLSCRIGDSRRDLVKGRVLIRIEIGNVLLGKISLLLWIIVPLLSNKGIHVLKDGAPISCDLWHAVPILKSLPRLSKKLVDEIKAIILDLLLWWLLFSIMKDRVALEIITNVLPKGVPQ
jgi:hypothetical protein